MDLQRIKVVSWAVDGTLYPRRRMLLHFACLAMAELFSPRRRASWRELKHLHELRRRTQRARRSGSLRPLHGATPPRHVIRGAERRWLGRAISRAGQHEGLRELLSFFERRAVRQVVLTDHVPDFKLDALGLRRRFSRIYAGEELGFLKPAPQLFRLVAADQKVAPDEILHIGDHDHRDGRAARDAGCQVAILGQDFKSFRELLQLLQQSPSFR